MELDSILKLAQILFYVGGLAIAALTYRRAKSTILNTVNTEYHKKVIERLSDLSEELYKEFDTTSDQVWYARDDVGDVVDILHRDIAEHKDKIVASGELHSGIPSSEKQMQLENLANRYKSDPFLPKQVREKVVGLLEKRSESMVKAYGIVLEDYMSELAKGNYWDTLDSNKYWLHNKILQLLRADGVGISEVESAIHDIRLEIQRYFSRFNPVS